MKRRSFIAAVLGVLAAPFACLKAEKPKYFIGVDLGIDGGSVTSVYSVVGVKGTPSADCGIEWWNDKGPCRLKPVLIKRGARLENRHG